jgi:uncharacterized protein involved in exopolysaccharide biosynthesis
MNPLDKLRSNRSRIGAGALAGGALAAIYALLAPSWYEATLRLVPARQSRGGSIPGIPSELLGGLDLPFGMQSNDVDRLEVVLQSNSVTDAVIAKFGLMEHYGLKYVEDARREVWSHCATHVLAKAGVVELTCEDKDPKLVKSMLDFFAEDGNRVFHAVGTSLATEEVRFLESRVTEERASADAAATRLRDFEQQNKIIDLETQSKAVVSELAALRSQAISKELELSYLDSFSSADEAGAVQVREQLNIVNAKLRRLDEGGKGSIPVIDEGARADPPRKRGSDPFPPANDVPQLRYEYERLLREQKVVETGLYLLMQRLELAKANAARDTSAFQVLDSPPVPTRRSRPHRGTAVLFGILVGVAAGMGWIYGPGYLRRALQES